MNFRMSCNDLALLLNFYVSRFSLCDKLACQIHRLSICYIHISSACCHRLDEFPVTKQTVSKH